MFGLSCIRTTLALCLIGVNDLLLVASVKSADTSYYAADTSMLNIGTQSVVWKNFHICHVSDKTRILQALYRNCCSTQHGVFWMKELLVWHLFLCHM